MSADEVWLTFCEFKDAPPLNFISRPGRDYRFGYYWHQSDVDEHEGCMWNQWRSLEDRDKELEAAGGLIGWLNAENDSDLLNAIYDAIEANDGFHGGVKDYIPHCYLYVNGSSINLRKLEDEEEKPYLAELKETK